MGRRFFRAKIAAQSTVERRREAAGEASGEVHDVCARDMMAEAMAYHRL